MFKVIYSNGSCIITVLVGVMHEADAVKYVKASDYTCKEIIEVTNEVGEVWFVARRPKA